jgi:hypothetical protein
VEECFRSRSFEGRSYTLLGHAFHAGDATKRPRIPLKGLWQRIPETESPTPCWPAQPVPEEMNRWPCGRCFWRVCAEPEFPEGKKGAGFPTEFLWEGDARNVGMEHARACLKRDTVVFWSGP